VNLFFYGTLMHDRGNAIVAALLPLLGRPRRAYAAGTLHAVWNRNGIYPALLPGRLRVSGWLYRARSGFPPAMLNMLDAYEEYRPGDRVRSEYVRRRIVVRLDRGGTALAQAYCWNRRPKSGTTRIASGDFAEFLQRTGLPAFAPPGRAART